MDLLTILGERYPGKEFLPESADSSLEPVPCRKCKGKTSTFIVRNNTPKTFESGKFLHVQREIVRICLVCKADNGITEVSQCLGRETP